MSCVDSPHQVLSEYHVIALSTFDARESGVDGRLAVFGSASLSEYSIASGVRAAVSMEVSRYVALRTLRGVFSLCSVYDRTSSEPLLCLGDTTIGIRFTPRCFPPFLSVP